VPLSYPILLDVADRLVVIVGGGRVAARKAAGLLSAGGRRVRCVSPAFCGEFPDGVERIVARYADEYLDGAALVFACTDDPAVNAAVVRDCRRRGIFVNRADGDDVEPGDFSTPAKFEADGVIVTVSAGSPALSAAIRDDLAAKLDRRFVAMASAMRLLRPEIRASRADISVRARIFRDLAGEEALALLDADGTEALRRWLLNRYPELKHG
jgi:siroheme synthase-like protein